MDLNSSPSSSNTIPVVSTFASPFDGTSPPLNVTSSSSSSVRKPISLWPGMYHSPVTDALWEARSNIFERLLDPPKDAPPQSELLTKTPSQSRTTILYGFSSDYILREQYRDPWNEVRIGKLLEDLDALAGTISVKVRIGKLLEIYFSQMGCDLNAPIWLCFSFVCLKLETL
jgi:acyl-coenzyme A thioesterase 9